MSSWIFHFRWVLWILGLGIFVIWMAPTGRFAQSWKRSCEERFYRTLFILTGTYFTLALLGKFSQYWSLSLHAQDFWLFVDQLEQMKRGGFFLTRFAPQSLGFVQHGSVHPMFSWAALLPLVWVLGSVTTAVIFNPLMLAAAGWMVGVLARSRWGASSALALAGAFLASTQVGKVLMYDVHPEAAYPFLTLLVLWALGLDVNQSKGKVRWGTLIFSTLLCAGVKEDSFLILFPWVGWGFFTFRGPQRRAFFLCGGLVLGVVILQALAVRYWLSGQWGPMIWDGQKVIRSAGVSAFQGEHWSGLGSVWGILQGLLAAQGGLVGAARSLMTFLFSRPWLSLIIFAPWLIFSPRHHLMMIPLVTAYALLDSPRTLWNYYSAPFLGTFWFGILDAKKNIIQMTNWKYLGWAKLKTDYWIPWTLGVALFLGSSSIDFYWPAPQVAAIREEAQRVRSCLSGRGLVASPLLGLISLENVWTDRLPRTSEDWGAIDFVLFAPKVESFELPATDILRLQTLSLGSISPCSNGLHWLQYRVFR